MIEEKLNKYINEDTLNTDKLSVELSTKIEYLIADHIQKRDYYDLPLVNIDSDRLTLRKIINKSLKNVNVHKVVEDLLE